MIYSVACILLLLAGTSVQVDGHIMKKGVYHRNHERVQTNLLRSSFGWKPSMKINAVTSRVGTDSATKFTPPPGSSLQLEHDPVRSLRASLRFHESNCSCLISSQVYTFGKNQKKANFGNMKSLLGGKGANLADMSSIGLSVPPGFTLTTEVCDAYHRSRGVLPSSVWPGVLDGVQSIENQMGRKFGDVSRPLLVSVRSGAAISMPGMMDTILNLGINDDTVQGLAKDFGEKFALVCDVASELLPKCH